MTSASAELTPKVVSIDCPRRIFPNDQSITCGCHPRRCPAGSGKRMVSGQNRSDRANQRGQSAGAHGHYTGVGWGQRITSICTAGGTIGSRASGYRRTDIGRKHVQPQTRGRRLHSFRHPSLLAQHEPKTGPSPHRDRPSALVTTRPSQLLKNILPCSADLPTHHPAISAHAAIDCSATGYTLRHVRS